jgi:hypothetical protein
MLQQLLPFRFFLLSQRGSCLLGSRCHCHRLCAAAGQAKTHASLCCCL